MPLPKPSLRLTRRTLWSIWPDRGGVSMHGEDFTTAYDEWEFTHTVGLSAITGPLCRQHEYTWLGWTVRTPWRIYATDPGREPYRPAQPQTE